MRENFRKALRWRRRLKLLVARDILDTLLPDELPAIAMEALCDNCEGEKLVLLATCEPKLQDDAHALFLEVLAEQRCAPITIEGALRRYVVNICERIVAAEISTDDGARKIFKVQLKIDSKDPSWRVVSRLGVLAFCSRDDYFYDPPQFDRDVLTEAAKWVGHGPLGPERL